MKDALIKRIYYFYESYIIPPQQISLLELKRKEFLEKSKYLDLKTLYNISDEEKEYLKSKGYYVDLSKDTTTSLKNFKISSNRHEGRYKSAHNNFNMAVFKDRYYVDQDYFKFMGDPNYRAKIYRARTRTKLILGVTTLFACITWINYYWSGYVIRKRRLKNLEFERNNKNLKLKN